MISRTLVVERALAILPLDSRLTVTLRKRVGGDITHSGGVSWQARRKGEDRLIEADSTGVATKIEQTYQLFKQTQTDEPEQGDELVADGFTWQIADRVSVSQMRGVFDCEAVRNV